jgi:hypothetical protein
MHLGSASIAINIARILWAFNVKPAVNQKGEKIDVDMYVDRSPPAPAIVVTSLTACSFAFTDGFNSIPLPFECAITPRSEKHARVIEKEYQGARGELQRYTAAANKFS